MRYAALCLFYLSFINANLSFQETQPPKASASHKHAHEPVTPSCPSAKRPRASHGTTALQDMSASLTQVGMALTSALAPPPNAVDPTPHCHTNAIAAVLHLEMSWLDNSQLVAFIDFICVDQTAADIYLALTKPAVHKEWVPIHLRSSGFSFSDLHFPPYHNSILALLHSFNPTLCVYMIFTIPSLAVLADNPPTLLVQ